MNETEAGVNPPDESPETAGVPAAQASAASNVSFEDVISGAFDQAVEAVVADPAAPPKRVLTPEVNSPKLHKVLAQAGMGSRLEMEALILEGRISVNGEPAHIGQRIRFGDTIKINGRQIKVRIDPPPPRVLAYHKPVGEVVTMMTLKTAPPFSAVCRSCRMANGSLLAALTSTRRGYCCSPAQVP